MNFEQKMGGGIPLTEEEKLKRVKALQELERTEKMKEKFRASAEEYAEGLPDTFEDNDQEKAA